MVPRQLLPCKPAPSYSRRKKREVEEPTISIPFIRRRRLPRNLHPLPADYHMHLPGWISDTCHPPAKEMRMVRIPLQCGETLEVGRSRSAIVGPLATTAASAKTVSVLFYPNNCSVEFVARAVHLHCYFLKQRLEITVPSVRSIRVPPCLFFQLFVFLMDRTTLSCSIISAFSGIVKTVFPNH